jgi:hypothetical protein
MLVGEAPLGPMNDFWVGAAYSISFGEPGQPEPLLVQVGARLGCGRLCLRLLY